MAKPPAQATKTPPKTMAVVETTRNCSYSTRKIRTRARGSTRLRVFWERTWFS